MLKKTITYPDLDGNNVTEDFYFNLSMAEVAEMELSQKGGFVEHLESIIEAEDGAEIIKTFKMIITQAVGRRSEDGKRFVKSQQITDEFMQTEAYSQLFMDLVTDGAAAAAFVEGIVPKNLESEIAKRKPVENVQLPDGGTPQSEAPAWIREDREPTEEELRSMSREELQEVFRRKAVKDNT